MKGNMGIKIATKNYVEMRLVGGITYQGSKTAEQINALDTTTLKNGYMYNLTNSGTLTVGSISVAVGDNVVWDGSGWDKLVGEYAPMQYVLGNYLSTGNSIAYTPTGSYHPATKQYVDNSVLIDSDDLEDMLEGVFEEDE